MSVMQIMSYVNALLQDWGVMPFIQAGLLVLTVVGVVVMIRRLTSGS